MLFERMSSAVSTKLVHDRAHGLPASLFRSPENGVRWCGVMRTTDEKRAAGNP